MRKSNQNRSVHARVIGLPYDAQLQFEQPASLLDTTRERKSLLLICDQIPSSGDLLQLLNKMFNTQVVEDPIAGLLALQTSPFDEVVIVLENIQSDLWVLLRGIDNKKGHEPVPILLFSPGMEASQMQKAYGLGVLFCCNRQLDARDISNQLTAFSSFHDRLRQSLLNKAGLHDDLLRMPSVGQDFLEKLNNIIKIRFAEASLSVPEMAKTLGVSLSTLERKCLQLTGMRPRAYLNEHRMLHAYQYITNGNHNIQEACRKSGFGNLSYFSARFTARFKVRPSDLIRKESRIA